MATIRKHIDPGSDPTGRSATWTEADLVAGAGDLFDVVGSLGRPARYLKATTAAGAALVLRVNSVITTYSADELASRYQISAPDWTAGDTRTNPNAITVTLGASASDTFTDIAINALEVVSVTVGGGITITVR